MTASAPSAPPAADALAERGKLRLARLPIERMALMVRVPDFKTTAVGLVTVTERKDDVVLSLEDFGSISRELPLTISEAYAVIEALRRIVARVRNRKPYRP